MRIGIDLLGSDATPAELSHAIQFVAAQVDSTFSLVVLTTKEARKTLQSFPACPSVFFIESEDVIKMSDDPLLALRHKKNSTLTTGIHLLKSGQIDALVSTGNTGALIAAATLMLPKLPRVKRPGLLATLPTLKKPLAVIDVGGNIQIKAEHLIQFALLGVAYQQCTSLSLPIRIGLLNVGSEEQKGTEELRRTHHLLQEKYGHHNLSKAFFVGNIEACDIFNGGIDVLVTDGFTGNVLLKTAEGMSSFVFDHMRSQGSTLWQETVTDCQGKLNESIFPAAVVCGIDKILIKCHGSATPLSMLHAIKGAINLLQSEFISKIKHALV